MLTPGVVALALTTVAGFVVLYTLIGAAGTHATLDWPQRLAFWGIAAVVCFPACYSKSVLVLYLAGPRRFPLVLLAVSAATVISALPTTALLYTLDRVLLPGHASHNLGVLYLWVFAPMLLGNVFVLYLVFANPKRPRAADAAVEGATARGPALSRTVPSEERPRTDTPDDGPAPQSPFLARLSTQPAPDLIYLKMNDHYVEAFTSAGSEIILMRFVDAVVELAGMGMQVHRSYWVSYRHVVRLVRDRHRQYVELAEGSRIPVSRTYLSAIRVAVEGLAAGREALPQQAWASGAAPEPESTATGATESRPSSKNSGMATPPQHQPAPEDKGSFVNLFVHMATRRSTVATPKPGRSGSHSQ